MARIDDHTLELLEFGKVLPECERRADSVWGRELARELRPFACLEEAQTEQRRLREWLLLEAGEPAPTGLALPDPRPLLDAVASGAVLDGEELLAILTVVQAAGSYRSILDQRVVDVPLLQAEAADLQQFRDLESLIGSTIDTKGAVRDDASPELRQIRQVIATTRQRLERRLEQIAANIGPASFVTRRGDRYTVSVPTDKMGQLKGVVHDRSASGASVFLEPLELVEVQNRLRTAEGEEQAEILRILRRIASLVRARGTEIRAAATHLARLDCLRARGRWLREMGGALPELTAGGPVRLKAARHPLLERALRERGHQLVPVDLDLGEKQRVLVVTGPNMGGKTVTLKTLGLLTVMAMAGLPVPVAEGSRLGFFSTIVADIGDEQSIEDNLSTFASHLRQISAAIEQAAPGALILLDELGAGTDPAEGGALGQAVLEHLAGSRALVMVTTHHGELKGMAVRHPTILNASMAFDTETLQPLYELVRGIPGRSLALDVAGGLGLRPDILARARQLVSGDESRLQELIVDLAVQRDAAAGDRQATAAERERVRSMRVTYQERLDRIRELRQQVEIKARQEAEEILSTAREALRAARRAVRQAGAGRPAAGPSSSSVDGASPAGTVPDVEAVAAQLGEVVARVEKLGPRVTTNVAAAPDEIRPGRRFWVPNLAAEVEVEAPPDRAGRVRVRRGSLRLELRSDQLQAPTQSAAERREVGVEAPARGASYHLEAGEPPGLELDLRGQSGDEAVSAVQRFLDQAVLYNLRGVRIIHGKGTGALRQRVQQALAEHPQVSNFRLGEIFEGGAGVTVAEIR